MLFQSKASRLKNDSDMQLIQYHKAVILFVLQRMVVVSLFTYVVFKIFIDKLEWMYMPPGRDFKGCSYMCSCRGK